MCTTEALNRVLAQMNDRLRALFGLHLKEAILYGSYARGDAD